MDAAIFKEHISPCIDSMYRVALALCGNTDDAEDAVQEACLKLWERRATLGTVNNIKAYAIGTARNAALDIIAARRHPLSADDGLQLADSSDTAADIERRETVDLIARMAERLPEKMRTVLVMRDFEGCEFDEIERTTGLSAGNIRVLLSRARTAIRKHFTS
ncbi:MAG: RNA polymerase sigma factor [Muribaculaceae bacterium]|nr:RNA polymerase sigma factor [Muribaculaceae bacterium]